MELNPIEYPKIIKFQIKAIEINAEKLFFEFLDIPSFRIFLGQKIKFVFNGYNYWGIYNYFVDDTTTNIKKHYLSNVTGGFVWTIPIDSVIDIYDTFNIEENNQLVNFQDIENYFLSKGGDYKLGESLLYEYHNSSKPGLLKPFDKSKLDTSLFLIKFKSLFALTSYDPDWNIICTLKTSLTGNYNDGKSNTFKLILKNIETNNILDATITILNDQVVPIVLFKINHCSILSEDVIQFRFVNLIFSDGIKRIRIEARLKISNTLNEIWEGYLGINQPENLNNSNIGYLSESILLFNTNEDIINVDNTLLEINNKTKINIVQFGNSLNLNVIAPLIFDSLTNQLAIDVNAFAPYGTVSFPGFGTIHTKAAYGDHSHNEYKTPSYTITLPNASTVNGRCIGAVEGTDYPNGWIIKAYNGNPNDFHIIHGLNKRIFNIAIYTVSGSGDRLLYGNASHSGLIAPDKSNLRIENLATIATPLVIQLFFI